MSKEVLHKRVTVVTDGKKIVETKEHKTPFSAMISDREASFMNSLVDVEFIGEWDYWVKAKEDKPKEDKAKEDKAKK